MMDLIKTHANTLIEKTVQGGLACFLFATHTSIMTAGISDVVLAVKVGLSAAIAFVLISMIPKLDTVHLGIWLTGALAAVSAHWWTPSGLVGMQSWTGPITVGLLAIVLMVGWEQIRHKIIS